MSKTLKISILLIVITLGFLFLGMRVNANENESESIVSLVDFFEGKNATITGNTITLKEDVLIGDEAEYGMFEITGGDSVLDLNGKTLTIAGEIYFYDGTLTIKDKTGRGEIVAGCIGFEEEVKVTIENGTFPVIFNTATLTIEDGNFVGVSAGGNTTIKGGIFESGITYQQGSKEVIISGGVFKKSTDPENTEGTIVIYGPEDVSENSIYEIIEEGYEVVFREYKRKIYEDGIDISYEAHYYGNIAIVKEKPETVLNKIAPNGVWTINGAKPNGEEPVDESESLLTTLANNMDLPKGYEIQAWCNGADNINTESVHIKVLYNGIMLLEKNIEAKWIEPSKEVADSVAPVINKIAEKIDEEHITDSGFVLEDLYLINYLNVEDKEINDNLALNFAKDLIELTNGSNMSYEFDFRCGDSGNSLHSALGGTVVVYYDNVPVDTTKIGLNYVNVIYVPKDTANSDDARIEAALKRITDYLGTNKGISMTYGGTLQSITEAYEYYWNRDGFFDETTSGNNYYNLTINGKTYKFVVCKKDANELETPKYVCTDVISNISVTSEDKTIPLDTTVTVNTNLTDAENKRIKETLGTDLYAAYDISLFSNAKNAKIKEINGKFKVSVPVREDLKNIENLTVYYIDDEGNKTDKEAKVDNNGIATFETNHFSTYVLAERVTYTLTLDTNQGKFSDGKTKLEFADVTECDMTKVENPVRDGYTFKGWFTEKTGGISINTIMNGEDGINKDTTFYAQWEKNSAGEPGIPEDGEQEGDNNNTGNTNTGNTDSGNTNTGTNNNTTTGENPKTGDNIVLFTVISIVAVAGIMVAIKVKKYVKE